MIEISVVDANNKIYPVVGVVETTLTRALNDIGAISIKISGKLTDENDYLVPGNRLFVRRVSGSNSFWLGVYIITSYRIAFEGGVEYYYVSGLCDNVLLKMRVVAYNQDTSQGTKTGYAPEVIRQLVAENLIGVGGTRDISAYGYSLISSGDLPYSGITVNVNAAWRNLFEVVKDVANYGDLYFGFVPYGDTARVFVIRQYFGAVTSTILDINNVKNIAIDYEGRDKPNAVYAGAMLANSARVVGSYAVSGMSGIKRSESYISVGDTVETSYLNYYAQAEYERNEPKEKISGSLIDNPSRLMLGRDINIGDVLYINYRGKRKIMVNGFRVSDKSGDEQIEISFIGIDKIYTIFGF
jgi:hypothetical protein